MSHQNPVVVDQQHVADLQYIRPSSSTSTNPDPPTQYTPSPFQTSLGAYSKDDSSAPYFSDELQSQRLSPFRRSPSARKSCERMSSRVDVAHPYARIYAKKDGSKRRKIWNHALEKSLFSPHELSSMGAPHRRTIYTASLEAHIDRLHALLLSIGYFPVAFDKLDPYRGLNSKIAKSMVAGLQSDASHAKLKLLELERSKESLHKCLAEIQLEEWRGQDFSSIHSTALYPPS